MKLIRPIGDKLSDNGNPFIVGDELFANDPSALPPLKREDKREYISPETLFEKGSEYKPTNREDIVGIDNVIDDIDNVIHWLRYSEVYAKYHSRLEPGIIFEGSPGTGKTLVSRYIATASGALFVNVRDWPHKASTYSSSEIAGLFKMARETYERTRRPIVLFWDEFEQGAWSRDAQRSDEAQAAVAELTAQLDGVHGKNAGVLLIGTTNYAHGIDPALRRSGRMGVHIAFGAPDRKGKQLLLDHYLSKRNIEGDIDLETLSYFFDGGASAADIEESCMMAWRFAVRRAMQQTPAGELVEGGPINEPKLAQCDLMQVFLDRLVGPPVPFGDMSKADRHRIAVHECGHALAALIYGVPVRLITVRPSKKAIGRVMIAEMHDHIATVDEMVRHMRVGLGSIAAEQVTGIPAMLGSGGDVRSTNEIAVRLVDRLDMDRNVGLVNIAAISHSRAGEADIISESLVEKSDLDVMHFINEAKSEAVGTMKNIGADNINRIAERVNDAVTLTGAEFAAACEEVLGTDDFSSFCA